MKRGFNIADKGIFSGSRKTAFTLAEVLITVGIIGVVAAITMPTVINNHQKKVTAVKLQRFYNLMTNALEAYKRDERVEAIDVSDCTNASTCETWFKDGLGKHLKYTSIEDLNHAPHGRSVVSFNRIFLPDGSCFRLNRVDNAGGETGRDWGIDESDNSQHTMHLFYSVDKEHCHIGDGGGKNAADGRYQFVFTIEGGNLVTAYTSLVDGKKRDDVKGLCLRDSEGKEGKHPACSRLIEMDGWKISDDYPVW